MSIPSPQSSNNFESIPRKTRILQDIYEELGAHSNYALFTYQSTFFEKKIKHEQWIKDMDEEIGSIERNETWDLVDLHREKKCVGVNGYIK